MVGILENLFTHLLEREVKLPSTYTSNNGQTVQGQQYDMNSSNMANMAMNPPSSGDVASSIVQTDSPGTRQEFLGATDFGAQQGNYEALARQLYDYDKMHLQPKYAVAPNQPSDRLSFGRVGESNLMQLTPEMAESTTLYADNPKFAVNSQAEQQNAVLSAMNLLNNALVKEASSAKGRHGASLDTLFKLLDRAMDREERAKDRAAAAADRANAKAESNITKLQTQADKLRADLATGTIEWGDAWNQLRKIATADVANDDIDVLLGGKFDASDPTGAKGLTRGWAKPGAAQEYSQGLRYKQTGTSSADDADFTQLTQGLDSYMKRRNETNMLDRINPTSPKGIQIETEKSGLVRVLAKLVEKNRISDADAKAYANMLPQPWMNESQASAAIQGLKNAISTKLGVTEAPSSGGDWE